MDCIAVLETHYHLQEWKQDAELLCCRNFVDAKQISVVSRAAMVELADGNLQHSVDSRLHHSSNCRPYDRCPVQELLEGPVSPILQSHFPHLPHPQRVTTRLQASSLNNSAFSEPLVHPLPPHSCQVTCHLYMNNMGKVIFQVLSLLLMLMTLDEPSLLTCQCKCPQKQKLKRAQRMFVTVVDPIYHIVHCPRYSKYIWCFSSHL